MQRCGWFWFQLFQANKILLTKKLFKMSKADQDPNGSLSIMEVRIHLTNVLSTADRQTSSAAKLASDWTDYSDSERISNKTN